MSSIKNIQMQKKIADDLEDVFPITREENVLDLSRKPIKYIKNISTEANKIKFVFNNGEVGSANIDVDMSNYLPLSGGTMTGSLTFEADDVDRFIYFRDPTDNGHDWRLGYVGSGDGDNNVFVIQSDKDTEGIWENVVMLTPLTLNTYIKGGVIPLANNTQTLGTASRKWLDTYSTTFHGALNGNAKTATTLETPRNINGTSFNGSGNININNLVSKEDVNSKLIYVRAPNFNGLNVSSSNLSDYFKALLKWICKNYPNHNYCTFILQVQPNSAGTAIVNIYNTSALQDELPQYSSGIYFSLAGQMESSFRTSTYTYFYSTSPYATIPVSRGGTGATTADAALTNLGAASKTDLTTYDGYKLDKTVIEKRLEKAGWYRVLKFTSTGIYLVNITQFWNNHSPFNVLLSISIDPNDAHITNLDAHGSGGVSINQVRLVKDADASALSDPIYLEIHYNTGTGNDVNITVLNQRNRNVIITVDFTTPPTDVNVLTTKTLLLLDLEYEIGTKAPKSHASTANTYGLGTANNYGHTKVINNLTTSSYADGVALSAYQGKVLNDKFANYTTTANLKPLATKGYSIGTGNPSGGSSGDIYDQYF